MSDTQIAAASPVTAEQVMTPPSEVWVWLVRYQSGLVLPGGIHATEAKAREYRPQHGDATALLKVVIPASVAWEAAA